MKKLLALMLALVMVFALAACGESSSDPSSEPTTPAAEPSSEPSENAETESDLAYVQDKGTLVVGITNFEPMDYQDENGEWIGFDADMAKLVAEELGVEIQFTVIDWDNKIMELESQNIDVVWNGMTLTDEVTNAMNCTRAYCNNAQVVVVPGEAQ